jgi:hypothetical protein
MRWRTQGTPEFTNASALQFRTAGNCRVSSGPQFAQTVAFLKRKFRASDHGCLTQCELTVKLKSA